MTPIQFPEANATFAPPPDLDESQCMTIHAYVGETQGGTVDGANMVVTAWKPSEHELEMLNAGAPVYLTVLGGLPPHMITTSFAQATNPR